MSLTPSNSFKSFSSSAAAPTFNNKICCVGAGYVGGPTMAMIANKCPDITCTIVDINQARIDAWNSDKLPVYEPGLDEVVQNCRGRNLFFSTKVGQAINEADMVFIAVNTNTKHFGHWKDRDYDLSSFEAVLRTIAQNSTSNKIIVEKSTVPTGTASKLQTILKANAANPDVNFSILNNPEFLAEGTAIKDLEFPYRVLIGCDSDSKAGRHAAKVLKSIYANWVDSERIITTNYFSSELGKLASNAMLSQRVSSINALSAICEASGADVSEISHILSTDERIGSKFLNASVGFGGSCFGKDLLALVYLAESLHLPEVAQYWKQVLLMNDYQKQRFAVKVVSSMLHNVRRKKLSIYGFAFKKDTNDFRDSPAITVVNFLLKEGAHLNIYDPKVPGEEILETFPGYEKNITICSSAEEAAVDSHALLLLTEWDEFKTLNYAAIHKTMMKPAYCFDGRSMVDPKKMQSIGFNMHSIGKKL